MKKTFNIKVSNKAPERQVESIKFEIKKYVARERRKKLPEDVDYWDFDCKIGDDKNNCEQIHLSEVNNQISKIASESKDAFYLEIFVKEGKREKKKSS